MGWAMRMKRMIRMILLRLISKRKRKRREKMIRILKLYLGKIHWQGKQQWRLVIKQVGTPLSKDYHMKKLRELPRKL